MSTFTIKEGDTSPAIEAVLRSEYQEVVDLTGATAYFVMRHTHDGPIVHEQATVDDADNGLVVYEWKSGDTDYPGRYRAEWRVEFPDGHVETFPNSGSLRIYIPSKIEVD